MIKFFTVDDSVSEVATKEEEQEEDEKNKDEIVEEASQPPEPVPSTQPAMPLGADFGMCALAHVHTHTHTFKCTHTLIFSRPAIALLLHTSLVDSNLIILVILCCS